MFCMHMLVCVAFSLATIVASIYCFLAKMSAEYIPFYWFLFSKAYYHLHKHSLSLIYTEKGKKFHFVDDMKR